MKTATLIDQELARHFEQIADLYKQRAQVEVSATDEVAAKSPQQGASDQPACPSSPRYRLAPKYKGKFAQLIKAVYDEGMFVKSDGTPATDVEDLGRYLGHALGVDYSDWRQTLRGAVLPDSALDFFERLLRWAKRYKDKVDNW